MVLLPYVIHDAMGFGNKKSAVQVLIPRAAVRRLAHAICQGDSGSRKRSFAPF